MVKKRQKDKHQYINHNIETKDKATRAPPKTDVIYINVYILSGTSSSNFDIPMKFLDQYILISLFEQQFIKFYFKRIGYDQNCFWSTWNDDTTFIILSPLLSKYCLFNVFSIVDDLDSYNLSVKSKITKILNSEENSKRKVPDQMAKSNDKTNQTKGQQLSYFLKRK